MEHFIIKTSSKDVITISLDEQKGAWLNIREGSKCISTYLSYNDVLEIHNILHKKLNLKENE